MTNLRYLNLYLSNFSSDATYDKFLSAIVNNHEQNPNLADINLYGALPDCIKISSSADELISALTAKGLTIAVGLGQHSKMRLRYPDMFK